MKTIFVILLLIILVFCAGCESLGVTVSYDDTVTKVPTLTTPNITPTKTITPVVTATRPAPYIPANVTAVPTELPTEEPTVEPTEVIDVANESQPYTTYTDKDFTILYPSNWSVSTTSINTPKTPYVRNGLLKEDTRLVRFESKRGTVNFTAQTTDFIAPGNYVLDSLIDTAAKTVTMRFSDVAGHTAITNYDLKYTSQYQTPYVTFDVLIPQTSVYYPHAYTERNMGSFSHFYTFRFNTAGNLGDYTEIKQVMFSSIKAEEKVKVT
jgi:hypothetical protein